MYGVGSEEWGQTLRLLDLHPPSALYCHPSNQKSPHRHLSRSAHAHTHTHTGELERGSQCQGILPLATNSFPRGPWGFTVPVGDGEPGGLEREGAGPPCTGSQAPK